MKIKTILVEDERHSLERLKFMLRDFDTIDIIGEAMDGESAVSLIDAKKPDLVILDIQLPVFNGFEVIERITHRPQVVFVTSYNQYAIKAFEENAVDYLLKPTSKERLGKSIKRILDKGPMPDEKLFALLKGRIFPDYQNRFAVKLKDDILIIPAEDVNYFRAEDRYVFLSSSDGEFIYDATLKQLEEVLDPKRFIRISRSAIVCVDAIDKLSKWFFGDYNLMLKDKKKTVFKVGRTYLPRVKEKLNF